MSFGFGVGDFIAVTKLTKTLRKDFVGAPDQFKAISNELRNLAIVLDDAEVIFSELAAQQRGEAALITNGCRDVLADLEAVLAKYSELRSSGDSIGSHAKRVWKRASWEPGDIHEFRDRIVSNVALLNSFFARITSEATLETKKGVDRLNKRQADEDRRNMLEWLTKADHNAEQHDHLKRRQEGTCQWLINSQEYNNWLESAGKTLFCPGIPGAGKTILASIVIEILQTKFPDASRIGICFVYCNYKRHQEQTLVDLLCSLLKQLARDQGAVSETLATLFNMHQHRSSRPSIDEILSSLESVIKTFEKVFILVDAVDECSTSDGCRRRLLSSLFDMQNRCAAVNVFATSRPIPEILGMFEGCISIQIQAKKEDVFAYVKGQLPQLPACVRSNAQLQDDIVTGIVKAVDGMFLLAYFHLERLKGEMTARAVRKALENLATGSDAYDRAYEDAMDRIGSQRQGEKTLALQTLSWLTHTTKPLRIAQFQQALAVEVDEPELDEENVPCVGDIVSVCAGLVTVDEESDIVRLVHYTTQEYFARTRTHWFPDADASISRACISYLTFQVFDKEPPSTDEEIRELMDYYCLYHYAARNWTHHGREAAKRDEVINPFFGSQHQRDLMISAIDKEESFWPSAFRQESLRDVPNLHLVALIGVDYAGKYIADRDDLQLKDKYGQTPLVAAVINGNISMVQTLLELRVEVDAEDRYAQTPLIVACATYGISDETRGDVVKLLIDNEADVNHTSKSACTPLVCAVDRNCVEVAQLLIEHGADVDSMLPLIWAARIRLMGMVRLLLQSGANIDAQTSDGTTALITAVAPRNFTTDDIFPENGARIVLGGRNGQTAKFDESHSTFEMVKLLLDSGAKPNVKCHDGETALSQAAQSRDADIVRLLLAHGADANNSKHDGETPLMRAVLEGRVRVAEALLQNGAIVTLESYHVLIRSRSLKKAEQAESRLFGPLPSASGHRAPVPPGWGYNAISIERGFESWLLSMNGVEDRLKQSKGITPLMVAVARDDWLMVELLLDHGAAPADEDSIAMLTWAARYLPRNHMISLLRSYDIDVGTP